MKRELARKGILGFMSGIFFCYTIAILISMFLNTGEFYPVDPALIDKTGSIMKATIIQYIGTGIIGSIMSISLVIFEKDEWSILFQIMIHFMISAICIMVYVLSIRTNAGGISQVALYIAILLIVYVVIWLSRIISCYIKIRKIKRKLSLENVTLTKGERKDLLIIRVFAVLVIGIAVCAWSFYCIQKIRINMVKTTDLTQIGVDGISIGKDISLLDVGKYTESDRYSSEHKYHFDELVLDIDHENKVSYIFSRFDDKKTDIYINAIDKIQSIEDITDILGENYYEKYQDKEQLLKKHIYYDRINHITAEFIYVETGDDHSENYHRLCWIKIFNE